MYDKTVGCLTVYVENRPFTILKGDGRYEKSLTLLRDREWDILAEFVKTPLRVVKYIQGSVEVLEGVILYKGNPIHNTVSKRILTLMEDDIPYQHIVRFFDRLMANPSKRSIDELYTFLEHKHLPITEKGTFLAYKGVQDNYYSVMNGSLTLVQGKADNSGHICNEIGQEIECPRNEVDDNKENHCSQGLHAGALEYAMGWGAKTVVVEIDPADVVSIPDDCGCQKLRNCHYKVICEFTKALGDTFAEVESMRQ